MSKRWWASGGAALLWAPTSSAQSGSTPAISMFSGFILLTLVITWWAARRTKDRSDFYAAGSSVGGFQNGLALSGDFMSAATFLGMSGLAFLGGFDALLFCIGGAMSWAIVLFLVAERLRNLGRYTFSDVVAYRLDRRPMRIFASVGTLAVAVPYLIAQMVGAGALVQGLFGIDYGWAVSLVGALMIIYVGFGGMLATTWVQIVKAVLLLVGGSVLGFGALAMFDFNLGRMFETAGSLHRMGEDLMKPGGLYSDPITTVSLALAFLCGTAGLPHVLMRFFTVPDARQARRSVAYAATFIAYFMTLVFFVGIAAIVLLDGRGEFLDASGQLIGGSNMVALYTSQMLGGEYFFGFISAVAFATILAVVSGLTLSASSAVSHDLYSQVLRHGEHDEKAEMRISRIATVVIGGVTIALSLAFEGQNVGVLATFGLAIAASVNFPVLVLAMYWRGLTTRGAVIGGSAGLLTAATLMVLGPNVWVQALGFEQPVFPYVYPTLFSVTAAFVGAWLFSVTDRSARSSAEKAAFGAQFVHSELGFDPGGRA